MSEQHRYHLMIGVKVFMKTNTLEGLRYWVYGDNVSVWDTQEKTFVQDRLPAPPSVDTEESEDVPLNGAFFACHIDKGDYLALEQLASNYTSAELMLAMCEETEDGGYVLRAQEHELWELGPAITEDNGYDPEEYGDFCGSVPCTGQGVYDIVRAMENEVV